MKKHLSPDAPVTPFDPILFRELPLIQKIIEDETWLEGERRGCRVQSTDRVVRDNVCCVILRIGQQLRESLSGSGVAHNGADDAGPETMPNSGQAA